MSKILEALQRAQEAREQEARDKGRQEPKGSEASEVEVAYKNTVTQDLWEHVRALEAAFNQRLTRKAEPAAQAPEPRAAEQAETGRSIAPEPEPSAPRPATKPAPEPEVFVPQSARPAEPAPATAAQPAQPAPAAKPKTSGEPTASAMPASPSDAIQKAIQQIQLRLVETEQLAARYATEQASLMAQLSAYDEMTAQLEQERATIHQRVTQLAASAASLETDRKALHNDIEVLRECYVLSHAAVIAEQELQTTHAVVSQLTQSQQRLGAEMTQYRQREDELQRLVIRLRSQLTQILAGTTGEPKGEDRPQ